MIDDELQAEKNKLELLWHFFSDKMLNKLHSQADKGWNGWDDKQFRNNIIGRLELATRRLINGDKEQAIDVANLAMFLHYMDDEDD